MLKISNIPCNSDVSHFLKLLKAVGWRLMGGGCQQKFSSDPVGYLSGEAQKKAWAHAGAPDGVFLAYDSLRGPTGIRNASKRECFSKATPAARPN